MSGGRLKPVHQSRHEVRHERPHQTHSQHQGLIALRWNWIWSDLPLIYVSGVIETDPLIIVPRCMPDDQREHQSVLCNWKILLRSELRLEGIGANPPRLPLRCFCLSWFFHLFALAKKGKGWGDYQYLCCNILDDVNILTPRIYNFQTFIFAEKQTKTCIFHMNITTHWVLVNELKC